MKLLSVLHRMSKMRVERLLGALNGFDTCETSGEKAKSKAPPSKNRGQGTQSPLRIYRPGTRLKMKKRPETAADQSTCLLNAYNK